MTHLSSTILSEIKPEVMQSDQWHEVFAVHMHHPEHITLLEGRGIVAALRQKLRAKDQFGKKHLHLNDNMSMVLLCSKGRSGAFPMLRICRRICALLIASNSSLSTRWIPSELNVADAPSRRWEHLRVPDAAVRAKEERRLQDINQRAYPTRSSTTRGVQAGFSGAHCPKTEEAFGEAQPFENPCGESRSESCESESPNRSSSLCGANRLGEVSSHGIGGLGLRPQDGRSEDFCQAKQAQPEDNHEVRRGLLLVSQQHLQSRRRISRRKQVLGCCDRLKPRLWPQGDVAANSPSSSRLVKTRSTPDPASSSLELGGGHCDEDDQAKQAAASVSCSGHVPCIPQTWRGLVSSKARCSESNSRTKAPCHPSPPFRKTGDLKGGTFRRKHSARLSDAAVAGPDPEQAVHLCLPVQRAVHRDGASLEASIDRPGAGCQTQRPVPAQTFRPKPRPLPSAAHYAGDQAQGEMSDTSMKRYTAGGRLNQEFHNLPAPVQKEVLKLEQQFTREGPKLFTLR